MATTAVLRQLIDNNPGAVEAFLKQQDGQLSLENVPRDQDERTPFHWLASNCHPSHNLSDLESCLHSLISRWPENLDSGDEDHYTPLYVAAASSNPTAVKLLLRNGANPHKSSSGGNSCLHIAATKPAAAAVLELLLEAGVELEARNDLKQTPLMRAVISGQLGNVEKLVEEGANIRVTHPDTLDTLLHYAVANFDKSVVRCLMQACPELSSLKNKRGATSLDFGDHEMVKYLKELAK